MKSLQSIPRAAFTLIELLVVISIIALLASIAVPTANVVMRKAKETQARAMMTGLIIGIKTYQTEYNRFPDPTGNSTSDKKLELDGGDNLMAILRPDQNSTAPAGNPRRINFYDPPIAKNGANGYDSQSGALVDSWSTRSNVHPIRVAIDYDGDGSVEKTLDPTHEATADIATPVIAWSTGSPINPPGENTDTKKFICSWK